MGHTKIIVNKSFYYYKTKYKDFFSYNYCTAITTTNNTTTMTTTNNNYTTTATTTAAATTTTTTTTTITTTNTTTTTTAAAALFPSIILSINDAICIIGTYFNELY